MWSRRSTWCCARFRHLELANGKDIHLEQIAHLVDRSVDEVRRALTLNEHIASLDAPLDIDPNHSIADAIADENAVDPENLLQVERKLATWSGAG